MIIQSNIRANSLELDDFIQVDYDVVFIVTRIDEDIIYLKCIYSNDSPKVDSPYWISPKTYVRKLTQQEVDDLKVQLL